MHSGSCLYYSQNAQTQTGHLCIRTPAHWLPLQWMTCSLFSWPNPSLRCTATWPRQVSSPLWDSVSPSVKPLLTGLWCMGHTTAHIAPQMSKPIVYSSPLPLKSVPQIEIIYSYEQITIRPIFMKAWPCFLKWLILRRSQSHTPASCDNRNVSNCKTRKVFGPGATFPPYAVGRQCLCNTSKPALAIS